MMTRHAAAQDRLYSSLTDSAADEAHAAAQE
jgi:hypothetical protein